MEGEDRVVVCHSFEALDVAGILASVRSEIRIVCSDADPYNPSGARAL
jgi:hypothetical protein